MITNNFAQRHIGPRQEEQQLMLQKIGVASMEELMDKTIPPQIRLKDGLNLPEGMNEFEYQNHINKIGEKNKLFRTYIGMGYYNTILPGVIQRMYLKIPAGTQHTPLIRLKSARVACRHC